MARMREPDTATSQFFINVADNTSGEARYRLDYPNPDGYGYAVFGKVVDGMGSVDEIRGTPVGNDAKIPGVGPVVPSEPVVIKSVRVVSEYDKEKLAAAVKAAEGAYKAAEEAERVEREKQFKEYVAKAEVQAGAKFVKTESGLLYLDLKVGTGNSPKPEDTVEVHYTGWLTDGTKFDSSVDRGKAATFPLNRVIKGWTEGVASMKVGGKRKLIIPPDLAYGAAGRRPIIPRYAVLTFDVELLSIEEK